MRSYVIDIALSRAKIFITNLLRRGGFYIGKRSALFCCRGRLEMKYMYLFSWMLKNNLLRVEMLFEIPLANASSFLFQTTLLHLGGLLVYISKVARSNFSTCSLCIPSPPPLLYHQPQSGFPQSTTQTISLSSHLHSVNPKRSKEVLFYHFVPLHNLLMSYCRYAGRKTLSNQSIKQL